MSKTINIVLSTILLLLVGLYIVGYYAEDQYVSIESEKVVVLNETNETKNIAVAVASEIINWAKESLNLNSYMFRVVEDLTPSRNLLKTNLANVTSSLDFEVDSGEEFTEEIVVEGEELQEHTAFQDFVFSINNKLSSNLLTGMSVSFDWLFIVDK